MHLQNLFSMVYVVKTKAPKELMKFLIYYQKKFKRKRPLFRQDSEIYSIITREHKLGTVGIKISSQMPKKLGSLIKDGIINFNYKAARICKKSNCGVKFSIFTSETRISIGGSSLFKAPCVRILKTELEDLLNFAIISKDVLLYLETDNLLVTGLLAYVFSPYEPNIYLLSSKIKLDPDINFLVLRDGQFHWSSRLGKLDFRESPVIRLEKVNVYDAQAP